MTHPIHQVTSFKIEAPYRLQVSFEDGQSQVIDFLPMLHGELFGALRDLTIFNSVAIDPQAKTLVWPNGADFDPATLHDWPEHRSALIARAATWQKFDSDLRAHG